jgi:hypothetical protein
LTWYKNQSQLGSSREAVYYKRVPVPNTNVDYANDVQIEFFDADFSVQDDFRSSFRIRSAYRNDADFTVSSISNQPRIIDHLRFHRMIDNDISVSQNYVRLMGRALHSFTRKRDQTGNEVLGDIFDGINQVLTSVFDDLTLTDLGNPSENGSFYFTKGDSKDFHYKNLSAGEKAAFDLLLDLTLSKESFLKTIYCIDEPEIHLNTRIQGRLLREMLKLIPETSQLWIATHAIGMMRAARDLWVEDPDAVCFLDFSGRDFDKPQTIEPIIPDRRFWESTLNVALDDLSNLVAPKNVVICEGSPRKSVSSVANSDHDAHCYNAIFSNIRPDTLFISGGNASEIISDHYVLVAGLTTTVSGAEVRRIVDRDARTEAEVSELVAKGIRVLSMRNLEGYLWSEEILQKLCRVNSADSKIAEVLDARSRAIAQVISQQKPDDDMKSASGLIYVDVKKMLSLHNHGNTVRAFMRNTLAPLVTPETQVFKQMEKDIFG